MTPIETKLRKPEDGYLEGYRLWVLVGCLTFAGFLLMLDESIISTAIPKITTDFGSLNDVGWYGTAYLLTNCALQPLSGKIYGEFNVKKSFLVFFIFELGSALSGAATSPEMLITGRAVAGMGGSGLLNGAYGIIHGIAPIEKQPRLLGIIIGLSLLGILSGPLIGGLLTEFASWRWCFYINIPSGGIAAFLLAIIPFPGEKNTTTTKQPLLQRLLKLDLVGFFFFAPAAMMLIFAIEWGGTMYLWNSPTIIGLFVGCGATFLVFVAWEHHVGAGAMIPLSIIRRRVIWSSCLYMLFFIGSALTAIFYLPLYFQTVRHASPTMSGVDLLPSIIATSLFSIVAGGLTEKLGYYTPWAISGSILAAIGTGLCSMFDPTTSIGVWIGFQIIMSAGRGLGFQTPIIAVQNHASKEEISIVNALVVFSQYLGGALFLSLDKTVFTSALKHFLHIHAPDVDPQLIVDLGALGVQQVEPATARTAVILAYSKAIEWVMYLGTASAAFGLIFAFGMGWTNVIKKAEADRLTNLEGGGQEPEKSIDSESAHSSKKTTVEKNPTH
ncbi:major facilitator superfamily domain-containing protein [Leptodontidium sp. MPI-SDFR-AT-0119]|nr:major facilitator superfamily domain-containing protein [Leptodontidium sp. MPI-SDFR-AT-0119]